ncbi:MAG: autotransporter domain-containing protein [Pseudomonadota bacterium]
MKKNRHHWKPKAIHTAVAIICANGIFMQTAAATPVCGPTVSADVSSQCVMASGFSTVDVTVNSGVTIAVTNATGAAVLYQGDLGYVEGSAFGSFTNNGTVSSSGYGNDFTTANTGVRILGELMGTLTNNHFITASASNNEGDAYAIGVGEFGSPAMQGLLNNNGTISATANASLSGTAVGLYVQNSVASAAIINNNTNGIIEATVNAQTGIAAGIAAHDITGTINNLGIIRATLNNTLPTSGIAFATGIFAENLNGTINNSGTISGVAADGGEGNSLVIYGGTGGTVNNLATGVLSGRLFTLSPDITVNNAGTIDLPLHNGSGIPIPYSGLIGGNYTQTDTGVLKIAAQSADAGGYSQLYVDGTATIAGKAFVDVKTVNNLIVGQTLTNVVMAGNTLTGNFSRVDDNSSMFNFSSVAYDGGEGSHIDFLVEQGTTATQSATHNGNNPALGAARVFDSIADGTLIAPGMQGVIDALGNLSTERQVSDAVSQTLPLLTGGVSQATGSTLHGMNRIIQSRQEGQHGRSSGDEFFGDKHAWFKPFGSWANQGDRKGVSGYDANTYGMVFGADAEISDSNRLGVAFAYARSNVDGNSSIARQTADVDSYQLVVYGSHNISDATDVNFQADIGRHNNEGVRNIALTSSVAKADYNSWSGHVGAGLAHTYSLSDKTSLTPSVRADYTLVRDESYRETGAGVLNLNVNRNTTEELVLGVDGKLAHVLNAKATFTANLGIGYDVINEQASITAAFAGAPTASFVTKGLDSSPWLVRGGLGVVGKASETVEVSARYDVEARKDFDNQTASVKVRWAF